MEPDSHTPKFSHKSLYAAFDVYPSAKGAATHIHHMAETLFELFNGGLLWVLGNSKLPSWQQEASVEIIRTKSEEPNYLKRGERFSSLLATNIHEHSNLELCHFRDIWGGLGILQTDRSYRTLFEVNGLPSIELPYRYPALGSKTLRKLYELEQYCMEEADHILVPAQAIQRHLMSRGIKEKKITVITNGATIPPEYKEIEPFPHPYLIYFGAHQPWQGLDDILKAFANLRDWKDLHLVICSSHKQRLTKAYRKLAEKLGIAERVIWNYRLDKAELNSWIRNAKISLAPLKACSRNISQGCSPLKILESMACGTAVVASDLPAVREIITDRETGRLVRPERPAELARVIRFLLEYPAEREELGENGRTHIQNQYQWNQKRAELRQLYKKLMQA